MDRWHDRCRVLVARTEAERLILGREVSPPVTIESLAQAREKWSAVRDHLLRGAAFARDAKWKESRDAYVSGMDNLAFAWWPAEQQSDVECLALQMGVAFVQAQDGRLTNGFAGSSSTRAEGHYPHGWLTFTPKPA